jgi:hypothetical protein
MLNFQVGHEVQIAGPIVEKADASRPPGIKVESILYLSRSCWKRGTTTEESAKRNHDELALDSNGGSECELPISP